MSYDPAAGMAGGHAQSGVAKYYRAGLMQQVIRNRQNPHHRGYVPGFRARYDVDGWAASVDCWRIGSVVTAAINGRRFERYQIVDCSATKDRTRHVRTQLVIEVDYESAVRNGFVRQGRAKATVWRAQ